LVQKISTPPKKHPKPTAFLNRHILCIFTPPLTVILVRYPFSDLTDFKIRPAVIISAPHVSQDF